MGREMIACYMRNVAIRAKAAHAYLNAKDREAAAHDVRIKFRGVLHSWIAKHSASIKAHKISARKMAIAWAARLHAEAHHQITLKELHVAAQHESHHHQMYRDAEIKVSNRLEARTEAHHWWTVAVANAKAAKLAWYNLNTSTNWPLSTSTWPIAPNTTPLPSTPIRNPFTPLPSRESTTSEDSLSRPSTPASATSSPTCTSSECIDSFLVNPPSACVR